MVTADHGNAEKMIDPKGGKHTAHTCNRGACFYSFLLFKVFFCFTVHVCRLIKACNFVLTRLLILVPFTCSSDKFKFKKSLPDREMGLCDVAPTVLAIMGLPIPSEMGGCSLVDEA